MNGRCEHYVVQEYDSYVHLDGQRDRRLSCAGCGAHTVEIRLPWNSDRVVHEYTGKHRRADYDGRTFGGGA